MQGVTSLVYLVVRRLRPGWVRLLIDRAGIDPLSPPSLIELPEGSHLMVLSPHPDDESIGCGGLIAKWIESGRTASVVFLSDGSRGCPPQPGKSASLAPDGPLAALRRREALQAVARLGGAEAVFVGLADGTLSRAGDILGVLLRELITRRRPDVVALPFVTDRHPDHTAVTPALLHALDGLNETERPRLFMGYEIWSPLQASVVIDITGQVDRKVAAINAHSSQTSQRDYAEGTLGLNRYRACSSLLNARYAEAFWLGGYSDLARLRASARV